MDLIREDARKLSGELERHDKLCRQIANLRRELNPLWDSLQVRKRQARAELEQVESELKALKREGLVSKVVRSAKEILHGGLSRHEWLEEQRSGVVQRMNDLLTEQASVWRRFRELVDREETLLREVYGERPIVERIAPWLFGVGALLGFFTVGMESVQPFMASMGIAGAGAASFWWNARRHSADRLFATEDDLWRRIQAHHDRYRERIVGELDNVGVLLEEFREPAVDSFERQTSPDGEHFRSTVALMTELARRDGHVVPQELEAIRRVLSDEFGLAGRSFDDMLRFSDEQATATRPVDLEEHLSRFQDSLAARNLVRLLYRVAFSDSRFFGREQTFIHHVARRLGLDQGQRETLESEERTLASARGVQVPVQAPVPADILYDDEGTERQARRRERQSGRG